MIVNELASAVYNDVVAGLIGIVANPTISMEQLEQDIVDERLNLIKKYQLQNKLPKADLYLSIPCIVLDCKSLDKCCDHDFTPAIAHFEIPQVLNDDFGDESIQFIGSMNKEVQFRVYTSRSFVHHKKRMRNSKRPYVYVDTTPNANNMYDCYVFDAPMLERLTIVAIFKDLRQVQEYACCLSDLKNMTFLDAEIKQLVTAKKIQYYRQLYPAPAPNNQVPK